jgi:hypothetical protein
MRRQAEYGQALDVLQILSSLSLPQSAARAVMHRTIQLPAGEIRTFFRGDRLTARAILFVDDHQ